MDANDHSDALLAASLDPQVTPPGDMRAAGSARFPAAPYDAGLSLLSGAAKDAPRALSYGKLPARPPPAGGSTRVAAAAAARRQDDGDVCDACGKACLEGGARGCGRLCAGMICAACLFGCAALTHR
jgi:hypothetical protein